MSLTPRTPPSSKEEKELKAVKTDPPSNNNQSSTSSLSNVTSDKISKHSVLDSSLSLEKSCHNHLVPPNSMLEKISIVDVSADPLLFKTFIKDWSKSERYSLSLACSQAAVEDRPESQNSIGFRETASSNSSTKGKIPGLVEE